MGAGKEENRASNRGHKGHAHSATQLRQKVGVWIITEGQLKATEAHSKMGECQWADRTAAYLLSTTRGYV